MSRLEKQKRNKQIPVCRGVLRLPYKNGYLSTVCCDIATLLNDEKTASNITESERNLIFQTLFTNLDTGLVKGAGENTELSTILTVILTKKP